MKIQWPRFLFKRMGFPSPWGRKILFLIPYMWVSVFLIVPFLIILKISFAESQISIPPYKELLEWLDASRIKITLNLGNYTSLFHKDFYLKSFVKSLEIAGISTFFCLVIAYPMAYFIAQAPKNKRLILLLLIVLPFWTSFLIRVYAWIGLLNTNGIFNTLLIKLGLIHSPLPLINNTLAVCVGIIYSYLPFMVLPLYAAIEKIDPSILEAAYDLGCHPFKAFLKVTVPLSLRGIITGCMIVFIPAMGEVVIPLLLGGANCLMVGKVVWQEFFTNGDWPVASALSIVLLGVLLIPIIFLQRADSPKEGSR